MQFGEPFFLSLSGTVRDAGPKPVVTLIRAVIPATPPLTLRGNAPDEHVFESAETSATFSDDTTLVLLGGDLQAIKLEAETLPKDKPITWDVARAKDDSKTLGKILPALTVGGPNGRSATLRMDAYGSFFIRARATDGDAKVGIFLPLVIARAELVADNSVTYSTVTITATPNVFRVNSGVFDITRPNDAAIHMNATLDVISGGPNCRRMVDKIFAGWVNNVRIADNVVGEYTGGRRVATVLAANHGDASQPYPRPPPHVIFMPGDAAPVTIDPPLLDSGRDPAGVGGDSATLNHSRIRSRKDLQVGQRWIVEAVDSPGDLRTIKSLVDGSVLRTFTFELKFSAAVALWTTVANGKCTERVYATPLTFHWDMAGEWAISIAAGAVTYTTTTPWAVSISNRTSFKKLKEAHLATIEVRAPTETGVMALDARS